MPLPAHETKHISSLSYPSRDVVFQLAQRNDGASNGTALWLGAQILSAFLADVLSSSTTANRHSRSTESNLPVRSCRVPPDGTAKGPNALRVPDQPTRNPTAIELGSGIGLSALTLASMGWDVLATDIQPVVDAVLRPNVRNNAQVLHPGSIQVRELDWTIPPEAWRWDDQLIIASHSTANAISSENPQGNKMQNTFDDGGDLGNANLKQPTPQFDLIITADTLYSAALITPLLRTLHNLCAVSVREVETGHQSKPPLIYLALENRDPELVSSFFDVARKDWNFTTTQLPKRRIQKALERSKLKWERKDWEGVEVWKLIYSKSHQTPL
ncbi:hypothetical protein SCHPADRAFT_407983 [Schizopora paradoxa]|uniref:Methyltransferase-domain-containing protein n=1 Tax=Schizopora paradoxa TaxID=27342 RepID=A0A0H2S6Y3_9AGAM|nr:hypothetical protein SCHPADRAFT_407983 [Schizopora paradoxa]